MFSAFFIERPKFAFVISIIFVVAGLVSIFTLPIAQYPQITPPQVQVSATYPGANAEVVEATVAAPLEAQINGVENMIYMSSKSTNDGSLTITVTFEAGTDGDIAAVNVQNRVSQALPQLPEEVSKQGVSVKKKSSDMLLVVNLFSPNNTYDAVYLSNYATINIRDAITRIAGVGDVGDMGGSDYAMRIWLDPLRMTSLGITTTDIVNAIREQNVQIAAGKIGQSPASDQQQFQYTVQTQGRLSDINEFKKIIIRAREDGSVVYLNEVARVELGAATYSAKGELNNKPSTLLAVYQLPDANAINVADAIKEEMEILSDRFPDDLEYAVLYDTTRFVKASINEVAQTLFIAVLLVIFVVYVFLQDVRSTLIPAIAIPVSLIGTFAIMNVLGYSINTISLFGLVLAIGIVVDDAIIVIENVQRLMADGLSAKDATKKAMSEVSGPIIATTLVLLAVFVPVGFIPGITGTLYQQFSVTISVAVIISSINALTLSPALCASILKTDTQSKNILLDKFEKVFDKTLSGYNRWIKILVNKRTMVFITFICISLATGLAFKTIPTGFVPPEDQGALLIHIQLPDGASLNRTEKVVTNVSTMLADIPGVADVLAVNGFSLLNGSNTSNSAMIILVLDPWEERTTNETTVRAILGSIYQQVASIGEANILAFNPPSIPGLGTTGGFEFELQDITGHTPAQLQQIMQAFIIEANQQPEITNAFSSFRADAPQYFLDINRQKAKNQDVALDDVFHTLQTQLGSYYVNDMNKFGRVYKVIVQADQQHRDNIDDIRHFFVRNGRGDMVPLNTLINSRSALGPDIIGRYNMYREAMISGSASPGYSSGDAIKAMERVASNILPDGYSYAWTGISLQEIQAGDSTIAIFLFALLFVYLFLVAQYESWSIPIAVLMTVPIAVFGAAMMLLITGLTNNIYGQVGLVLLIALSTKNAILIVEFAKVLREEEHLSTNEAACKAANLRFRAVMMTALSFVLGVLPLVTSSGAGAMSRISLGFPVLGGMLSVAIIGTIMIPIFYVMVQSIREKLKNN